MITRGSGTRIFSTKALVVFTLSGIVSGISVWRHELWGDELQGWNLVRSLSFSELLSFHHNCHPYLWNLLVFVLSRFTGDPAVMKLASWVITCALTFVLLFRSPFPLVLNVIILCGYYFLFEYAAFSRGYSLVVLFCFLLTHDLKRHNNKGANVQWLTKVYPLSYLIFLGLLAASHVLGLLLATGFHFSFLVTQKRKAAPVIVPALILLLVALTYFIPEGGDNVRSVSWYTGIHPSIAAQAPLRAFFALPDISAQHFWNTNLLLDLLPSKILQALLSIGLIIFLSVIIKASKAALLFFITAACMMHVFALVFPLTSARYVGLLFIAFLSALWMTDWTAIDNWRKKAVYFLLILQVPGGLFAASQDWARPFSEYNEVRVVAEKAGKYTLVTDTWGLNYLSATFDRAFYSIDAGREERRVILTNSLINTFASEDRYQKGLAQYFAKTNSDTVYLFSTGPGLEVYSSNGLKIAPILKKEGAIEKFSNVYLYKTYR